MMNLTNEMRTVKVGILPGRLTEVAVTGDETVREVFEMANVEVLSGYETKADGENISLDAKVGNINLLLQVKLIKGNATIKCGLMPGRLVELATTGEETIEQIFDMAGITLPSGYEVRMDGEKVSMDAIATGGLIVGSKLIKGNVEKTVKVGMLPGRLTEVIVDNTTTAREVFDLAGVEVIDGYEIKGDGETISLDAQIGNINLLLLVKKIKGNK